MFDKVEISVEQFSASAATILKEMSEILAKKNADYGGASMDMGMTGIVVHIHDKERRLVSLIEREEKGGSPNFEGINDTLRDLIGYCTIGLIIRGTLNLSESIPDSSPQLPPIFLDSTLLVDEVRVLAEKLYSKFYNNPLALAVAFWGTFVQTVKSLAPSLYLKELQEFVSMSDRLG